MVFTADDVKYDASFTKLDVNVKNRTAVAGSIGYFKLERKTCYFIASSTMVNQKVCKKKYLSRVYDVDR